MVIYFHNVDSKHGHKNNLFFLRVCSKLKREVYTMRVFDSGDIMSEFGLILFTKHCNVNLKHSVPLRPLSW